MDTLKVINSMCSKVIWISSLCLFLPLSNAQKKIYRTKINVVIILTIFGIHLGSIVVMSKLRPEVSPILRNTLLF